MSADENKAIGARFVAEVLTGHNLDAMSDFVHEDFVEENPVPGQESGREQLGAIRAPV
jgi:hypothetical protein